MIRFGFFAWVPSLLAVTLSACTPAVLSAAAPNNQAANGQAVKNAAAKSVQRISFRTGKAVTKHYDSKQAAEQVAKTLKQLGCDAKMSAHDNHIDLRYECAYWRSLTLKTAAEVAQWETWLTKHQFFVVNNTPAATHGEVVQYRMTQWRSLHLKPAEQQAYVEMFKMLGCEVGTTQHGDHQDLRVRCAQWQNLGLPNHPTAHAWMNVLQKLGFQVLHEH